MSTRYSSTWGTNQHYIPAAFLGRFSQDVSKPSRARSLCIRDVRAPQAYRSSPGKIAREIGLYDVTDASFGKAGTADGAWGYEAALPQALDALAIRGSPVDGRLWTGTAVPFVASLFVRGPEFREDFANRIPVDLSELVMDESNNATAARVIDFQVLLAPLMAARWTILRFRAGAELVTSDTGYALTATPAGTLLSYVVPIDPRSALVVTPRTHGRPLRWAGDRWVAELDHVDVADAEVSSLNRAIGAFARHAVYGPTMNSVEEASFHLGMAPPLRASLFPKLDPSSHLYDYFRVLATIASDPPKNAQARHETVEWSDITERDWTAPVVVEVLFPDRTRGGVRVEDGQLVIDLAYGLEARRARQATRDFRMGAMALLDLATLRRCKGTP